MKSPQPLRRGAQSRLLRHLQPIEFSADLLKLLRDFTGRQWVFNAVDRWFADPAGARVFWLTGAPGVGKSAIAAWIREHRREVAAFHFCDINSEELFLYVTHVVEEVRGGRLSLARIDEFPRGLGGALSDQKLHPAAARRETASHVCK